MLEYIFTKVFAAQAEETGGGSGGKMISTSGLKGGEEISNLGSLDSLVQFVINLVFGVGLALALLFVIIGGIKYITSQGDEGKATEARNTITNAVIGAVVIIAFRVLINLALSIIGGGTLTDYFGSN